MPAKPVDAFGQQLWDIHRHGYPYQIIERSDGLIAVGPGDLYFREYADWTLAEQEAMRWTTGRVLDVGCGAGRHALHLQEQGLDVLGIDISPLAIRVCRDRGLRRARVLAAADVHQLAGRPFDTVLMLGNNLGLLASATRGRKLLRKLEAITSESARIIAGVLDPYQTDDPLHRAYHRHNVERGRMGGQIRMRVRHKTLIGPWFDYLFLSRPELATLLDGTDWRVARTLGAEATYVAILEKRAVTGTRHGSASR